MLEYRTVPFLIGVFWLTVVATATESTAPLRSKRQVPNINVHQIPKTSFSCNDKKIGEYYADEEANCQVYHVCIPGMHNKMSLMSFACPNGTIFSQATRVCTPYERVHCSLTSKFYNSLHGNPNNKRTDYEADSDYENYVPQPPPRAPAQAPPRAPPQSQPRVPAQPPRQQVPPSRRNTPPPVPQTEAPAQPPRSTRFRSGSNQFRGQQVTTQAPVRQPTTLPPQASRPAPARPGPPAFRPPVLPARPVQPANVAPPRPTPRPVVSTSTSSYNYEYEYEYDYEDDTTTADQGSVRAKREAVSSDDYYDTRGLNLERAPQKTSFTCQDKVAGGVYADMETDCEMFHICVPLGKYKMLDYKVYCANGTAFDQETGSCQEKEEFICENAQLFYQLDKPNQPISGKKPVYKKAKYTKSKKATLTNKE